jgi:hypothetical protein
LALCATINYSLSQPHQEETFIKDVIEAAPYPGAKPSFLIEEKLENRDWLKKLVVITANELPEPKPKKKKAGKK